MTETKIIAALAHECRLKWARCNSEVHMAMGVTVFCGMHRGHSEWHGLPGTDVQWSDAMAEDQTNPLPDTLEAWAAEWAAERPGEPGPVREWASVREWTSEDVRTGWRVNDGIVEICVGDTSATRYLAIRRWSFGSYGTSADVADLVRLMQAADKAGAT